MLLLVLVFSNFRLSCFNWWKPKCGCPPSEVSRCPHQVKPAHTFCRPSGWDNFWRWCAGGIYGDWWQTWDNTAWPNRHQCDTKYDHEFESIHSTFIISAECLLPCCQVTLSQKLKSGHSRDTNIVVKAQGVSTYLLKEEIFNAFLTKGVMTNRRVEMHGSRRWLFRLLIWRSMFQNLVNACSSMESCSYQNWKRS